MRFIDIFAASAKHLTSRQIIEIANELGNIPPEIKQLTGPERANLIINAAGDVKLEKLHKDHPEYFALDYYDLKKLCGEHNVEIPAEGQLQFLARHGDIKLINPRETTEPNAAYIDLTYAPMYDAVEIAKLPRNAFLVPDLPDYATLDDIRRVFGWTDTVIKNELPEPKLGKHPLRLDTFVWNANDIEALAVKRHQIARTSPNSVALQEALPKMYRILYPANNPFEGQTSETTMLWAVLEALIFQPNKQIENPMKQFNAMPMTVNIMKRLMPDAKYWREKDELPIPEIFRNIIELK